MSHASLPYTTLDGPLRLPEPVSWYWRLLAHVSAWLIIGGFLAFPWLTLAPSTNPNGTVTPAPAVSATPLIIIVTSFITAGYALTPLLVFATPHNRDFHLHSVYLPELSASLFGTISHILVSSLSPNHSISSLPGVLGSALGVLAAAIYAGLSLYCSGLIHFLLGRPDPHGRRAPMEANSSRPTGLKLTVPNTDRSLSYSSSVVPLNTYSGAPNQTLHHQSSSTSMNPSIQYGQPAYYSQQQGPQHRPSASENSVSYFPPAPFIHPLQNFNWQHNANRPPPDQPRQSTSAQNYSPHTSQEAFPQNGPVSIVHRPNVGMTTSDVADDELTRRQMMALLSRSDAGGSNSRNGSYTYQIDFPNAPRSDGWDSSTASTPQPSVANTPSAYYGSNTWHGAAANATWAAMDTLPESPPRPERPASVHEVEGIVPSRAPTQDSVRAKPRANSVTKAGFHEPPPVAAKIVPLTAPKIIIPPAVTGMNALGAAVLRGEDESDGTNADSEIRRRREERAREKERARQDRERRRSSSTATSRSRTPGRSPADRKPGFQEFRAAARRSSRSTSVNSWVEGQG